MTAPAGRLADNIVRFARTLRAAGVPVGPGAVIDALEALDAAGVRSREDVYWTLHAVFVKRRDHVPLFEQAFGLFFRKRGYLEKLIASMSREAPPQPPQATAPVSRRVADAFRTAASVQPATQPEVEIDARLTLSDREVLQRRDFAEMSAAEIAVAARLVAGLVLPDDRRAIRRLGADPRGGRIDPRRSFRASMRGGGDLIALARRAPVRRHPPVVAIVDISGSMAAYSRVFLHFLHALGATRRVTTFLFGTRLTNVTRALARRDPDEALRHCAAGVEDWSGGTRIGASLHLFNRQWSRRVMSQGPVVLLFTDGLERDVDGLLAVEIDRLHRSCRRLVWLNPLLRFDGFEARAAGIRAMLPNVDEFRPIHNLDSIAGLVDALGARQAAGPDPRDLLRRAG